MRLFSDSIDFVGCVYSRISFYDLRFLVAFWRTFLLLFVIVFRCIEVMRHKKSIFSSFFICWIFGGSLVGLWWVFGWSLVGPAPVAAGENSGPLRKVCSMSKEVNLSK